MIYLFFLIALVLKAESIYNEEDEGSVDDEDLEPILEEAEEEEKNETKASKETGDNEVHR